MRIKFLLAVTVLLIGSSSMAARADIIYNINATLVGGGTVTGTFQTNNARTALSAANITVSASGAFTGDVYNLANSTIVASLPTQYFQLSLTNGDQLRVYFGAGGLTATGGTLALGNSYSHDVRGNPVFASGSVTLAPSATPEPSSLLLLGTGVLSAAGLARRRLMR